jgi:hypothetical protein
VFIYSEDRKGSITARGKICTIRKSMYKFLTTLTVSSDHIHYFQVTQQPSRGDVIFISATVSFLSRLSQLHTFALGSRLLFAVFTVLEMRHQGPTCKISYRHATGLINYVNHDMDKSECNDPTQQRTALSSFALCIQQFINLPSPLTTIYVLQKNKAAKH